MAYLPTASAIARFDAMREELGYPPLEKDPVLSEHFYKLWDEHLNRRYPIPGQVWHSYRVADGPPAELGPDLSRS
jgi:hypothetical protein